MSQSIELIKLINKIHPLQKVGIDVNSYPMVVKFKKNIKLFIKNKDGGTDCKKVFHNINKHKIGSCEGCFFHLLNKNGSFINNCAIHQVMKAKREISNLSSENIAMDHKLYRTEIVADVLSYYKIVFGAKFDDEN